MRYLIDCHRKAPSCLSRYPLTPIYRGRELNPDIFFSNFSGASGISRQNPGISRQKSLIPWVSRDIPNFLAPTPSRGRPPPHQKISGLKSLGLGSFFVPETITKIVPWLSDYSWFWSNSVPSKSSESTRELFLELARELSAVFCKIMFLDDIVSECRK